MRSSAGRTHSVVELDGWLSEKTDLEYLRVSKK
jgi:hypothetical protein